MSDASTPPRNKSLGLLLLMFATVLVVFLSWCSTSFKRELTDEKMAAFLQADARPRDTQHALERIVARLAEKRDVSSFRPAIAALAVHERAEVRSAAAWVMGHEEVDEYHAALKKLLDDAALAVRRNAALSLANYSDARARPVLRRCLEPLIVKAPVAGRLEHSIQDDASVGRSRSMAAITDAEGGEHEVQAAASGRVLAIKAQDGDEVTAGQALFELTPDGDAAFEALRALYLVGKAEDIPAVQAIVDGAWREALPDKVRVQAGHTLHRLKTKGR